MRYRDEVEYEEKNYDWLLEKFMKIKEVADLWANFVNDEYQSQPEPPDREDDR